MQDKDLKSIFLSIPNSPNRFKIEFSAQKEIDLIELIKQTLTNFKDSDFYLIGSNSRLISSSSQLSEPQNFIDLRLKLFGGKGGFGTLMKNQAISKRKFTSTLASRNLNGKRVRDIKNEIRIKKWLKKKMAAKLVSEKDNSEEKAQIIKTENIKTEINKKFANVQKSVSDSFFSGLKGPKNESVIEEEEVQESSDFKSLFQKIGNKNNNHKKSNKNSISKNLIVKDSEIGLEKFTLENLKELKQKSEVLLLNPEIIKNMLRDIGAKFGGTFEEKTERLWLISQKPELILDKKFHN